MNNENSVALFQPESGAMQAQSDAAAVARAVQEVQAALVIAARNPRDEIKAEARIMQACQRKSLAEVAEYEYSRGGTKITGPTIDLLRAIANRWGNLRFGWTETERREGMSSVRAFAWDLQSNAQSERTFVVRHWRDTQGGGYALNDERDIYELLANQAARRVRACLEEVIDADIVDKAIDQCRVTMRSGEKLPIKDRAAKVVNAFSEFGVTQEMIETRLGNKMEAVSENQLASLRRIYKSLMDGVGKREDYFKPEPAAPVMPQPANAGGPTASPEPPSATQTPPKAPEGNSTPRRGRASRLMDPQPQPEHQPEPQPQPPAEPLPVQSGMNPVRALRGLCKESKIAEGELLGLLADFGSTDGSVATLEELMLQFPQVAKMAVDQWSDLLPQLKGE